MNLPRILTVSGATVLLLCGSSARGNMASVSASDIQRTGNLVLRQKAAIQLEYENLSIRLDAETATVSVTYEFANSGADEDVAIGFPIDLMPPHGDETSYGIDHWFEESLTGLQIYDGEERVRIDQTVEEAVPLESRPRMAKDVSVKRRWSLGRLHFERGEHKEVRVNYTVRCIGVDRGFEGTMDGTEFTPRTFLYTLRPASSWGNGHVAKLDVLVDASFLRQNRFDITQVEPKPQGDRGGIFRWSFENLDLKTARDFLLTYDAKPALFQKWAERISFRRSENLRLKIFDGGGANPQIAQLFDRNPETAWTARGKLDGVGAFFEFRPLKDAYVSQVAILNGSWASEAEHDRYARVKKLRIEYVVRFEKGPRRETSEQILPDHKFDERALRYPTYYADFLDLPGGPEGILDYIKLTVLDVYSGTESKPLAISELYVYGNDLHGR